MNGKSPSKSEQRRHEAQADKPAGAVYAELADEPMDADIAAILPSEGYSPTVWDARVIALAEANRHQLYSDGEILARAKAFYAFLTGEVE